MNDSELADALTLVFTAAGSKSADLAARGEDALAERLDAALDIVGPFLELISR